MKKSKNMRFTRSRKRISVSSIFGLIIVVSMLAVLLCGCTSYEQPGETAAEGQIRHKRVLRINQQEMMEDINRFFLLDKPSSLTDKRIP
jgi:hypothetical protein